MRRRQLMRLTVVGLVAIAAFSVSTSPAAGAGGDESPGPRGAVDASRGTRGNPGLGGEETIDRLPELPPSGEIFEQQGPESVDPLPVDAESVTSDADGGEAVAEERGAATALEPIDPFSVPSPAASESLPADPSFERWLGGSSEVPAEESGQRRPGNSLEAGDSEATTASLDSGADKAAASENDMLRLLGMVAVCAVLAALLIAAPVLVRRYLPGGARLFGGEVVRILGRAHLGPKHSVHVIRVGERVLVLGVADGSVRTLSELTEPEEVTRLMARATGAESEVAVSGEEDTERDAGAGGFAGGTFARLLRRERSSYGAAEPANGESLEASAVVESGEAPHAESEIEAQAGGLPQRSTEQSETRSPSAESRAFASVLKRSRATLGSLSSVTAGGDLEESNDEVSEAGSEAGSMADERVAKARDEVERIRDVLSTLRGRI